jgi:hypothetical protein
VFFALATDVIQFATEFFFGYYNDNYINSYYEVVNDTGSAASYGFVTTTPGEYYVGIHLYSTRQYPSGCLTSGTSGLITLVNTATGQVLGQTSL